MRRSFLAAMAALSLAASLGMPARASAVSPTPTPKVAIIVGPVGSLTPTYLHLAELAAGAAEAGGATVARAYSPQATPANVLAAVADAHVVIYFGHGYGHPSPYGPLDTTRQNGWGLQGPAAHGTHGDSLHSEMAYFGEDWIIANARPAPGFVMIYSNTCYAPGASEGGFAPATPAVAAERVAAYSRKVFAMGGSAYYAVDFDRGAADLVGRMLGQRSATFGSLFATDSRYLPSALTTQPHLFSPGQEIWLHRSKYTDGPPNYWYAFAGNPAATPARSWDPVAPTLDLGPGADAIVPDRAVLSLRMSEPIVGLAPEHLRLADAAGAPVEAAVRVDAASGDITVQPAQPLALSARYSLQLAAGAADVAGNPLVPRSWAIVTRPDADPLVRDLSVRLEPGRHELVRFDSAWNEAERRTVDLDAAMAVAATARARLPGRDGTWLALRGDGVDGWWVPESPAAHAVGAVGDAMFAEPLTIVMDTGEHALFSLDDGVAAAVGSLHVGSHPHHVVDRRTVLDGVTYLRLRSGATGVAGRWIVARPGSALHAAALASPERRIAASEQLPAPAELRLRSGDWTLFRLDADGRVLDRRAVPGGDLRSLVSDRQIVVGAARMFQIVGGDHAGWAVREDARVEVIPGRAELGAPD